MGFGFFHKKKERPFLVLDIGTEAVKLLKCLSRLRRGRKENNKIVISGSALQYFEKYGVFDNSDFEAGIIKKAISKAIEGVDCKKSDIVVSLAPNIFKARIVKEVFSRENPKKKISKQEEGFILKKVFSGGQQKVSQKFVEIFGILAKDIQWVDLKILETRIDGYSVRGLEGYDGKELDFDVLITFLPIYYFESIKKIFEELHFKISKIEHLANVLPIIFGKEIANSIFFDVGGSITQMLTLKNQKLVQIKEIKKGGEDFTQELSETLGIDRESARELKERYGKGFLSSSSSQRIKEIFSAQKHILGNAFGESFSLPIFLFGGASLLPDIQEIFQGSKVIYPENFFKDIEDPTKSINTPQYIPALLIAKNYAQKIL